MPELPDLSSPAFDLHKPAIVNLYNVIELVVSDSAEVAKLQDLVVTAVHKLIEGDTHLADHLLNSVGQEVNRIANKKL